MKKVYIFLLPLFFAVACNSGIDQSNEVKAQVPSATPASFPLPDTTPVTTLNDTTIQPSTTVAGASVNKPAGALNPAHGQPGHRCDLAVGAPLTGAAPAVTTPAAQVQTTTAPVTNQITPAPQLTLPAASKSAKGVNPAHGQPGHRCDIAVGAPLSGTAPASSPAATTTPVNLTSTPAPLQPNTSSAAAQTVQSSPFAITPPPQLGSSANTGVRLNPAHGQPGHDCKIEVGKPLKQ